MEYSSMFCLFSVIFLLSVTVLPLVIYAKISDEHDKNLPRHNSNHPGLVKKTSYGLKDIYCPNCNSPYCMKWIERGINPVTVSTKTKVHPINPFKPVVEEVTTISGGNEYEHHKIRCRSCGYVFYA